MCDQTEISYLPGDVVWVKLGPVWWPGVICNNEEVPSAITKNLRKTPIAIIKFFQEEQFEYVHSLSNIYRYNCLKKNEFIKKGLDMFRSKSRDAPSNMKLFPEDVARAEILTNGDPHIVNDDIFRPEEKPVYTDLFASTKKTPKKVKPEQKKRTAQPAQPSVPRIITHPRFLKISPNVSTCYTDYEVRERQQIPFHAECDEEDSLTSTYRCPDCEFTTVRLNVIILHNKSHIRNYALSAAPKKAIKRKYKYSEIQSLATSAKHKEQISNKCNLSNSDPVRPVKIPKTNGALSTPRKPGRPKNVVRDKTISPEVGLVQSNVTHSSSDITPSGPTRSISRPQNDEFQESLLDDWAEYETTDQEANDNETSTANRTEQKDAMTSGQGGNNQTKEKKNSKKSCFDFDDSEDLLVIDKSKIKFGRKIPRVLDEKSDDIKVDSPVSVDTRVTVDNSSEEGHLQQISIDNEVEVQTEEHVANEQDLLFKVRGEEKPAVDQRAVEISAEIPRSLKKEHIKMYNASLAQQVESESMNDQSQTMEVQNEVHCDEGMTKTTQTKDSAIAKHEHSIEFEKIKTSHLRQIAKPPLLTPKTHEIQKKKDSQSTCKSESSPKTVDSTTSNSEPKSTPIHPSKEEQPKPSSPKRPVYRLTTMSKLETISTSQLSKSNSSQISKNATHPVRTPTKNQSIVTSLKASVVQSLLSNIVNASGQQTASTSGKFSRVLLVKTNPKTSATNQPHLIPTSRGSTSMHITASSTPNVHIASSTLKRSPKGLSSVVISPGKKVLLSAEVLQKLMKAQLSKPTGTVTPPVAKSVTKDAENANKKEDILAKALQDTDVLQTEISLPNASSFASDESKVTPSVTLCTPPIMSTCETLSHTATSEILNETITISDTSETATTTAE